jgi:hypothetical protein
MPTSVKQAPFELEQLFLKEYDGYHTDDSMQISVDDFDSDYDSDKEYNYNYYHGRPWDVEGDRVIKTNTSPNRSEDDDDDHNVYIRKEAGIGPRTIYI